MLYKIKCGVHKNYNVYGKIDGVHKNYNAYGKIDFQL